MEGREGLGTAGPCEWQGLRDHGLSPVSFGTSTVDHVLVLACLWFSSVVFRASKTNSALFSRIPCLGLSRTPYSRLQRPCLRDFHKQPGPQGACWGFGLGLFCFVVFSSSFSRRDVQCFTWIQIQRHSLKCCIAISITWKWEKCEVCFPLICESLGSELAHVP